MKIQECMICFATILLWMSVTVVSGIFYPMNQVVYNYTVMDIDGNPVKLDKYKGRVLVIVNYAPKCGFTLINEYRLSELAITYNVAGLSVLMFPSNNFLLKNFSAHDVGKSLKKNHPEFDVFSEVNLNGDDADEFFVYLKDKAPGFLGTKSIKYSFTKFIIDKSGFPVKRYSCTDSYWVMNRYLKRLMFPEEYKKRDEEFKKQFPFNRLYNLGKIF